MKKYIIEIKLKKEKYARYYYDIERDSFGLTDYKFWINSNASIKFFDFENIDYFRIIEQGE